MQHDTVHTEHQVIVKIMLKYHLVRGGEKGWQEGSAGTEITTKYEFCQLDSRLRLTTTDAETKDLEDVRSY